MKISEVLREAARRMEGGEDWYSCCAVSQASRVNHGGRYLIDAPERRAYSRLLKGPYSLQQDDFGSTSDTAARDHRVLALCMAATLAEERGL